MPSRDLVVLIVAYRSAAKLEACLQAAQKYLPACEFYVWDNSGPSHPEVRLLADRFRDVHWFTDSANIGFAAAVNRLAAMVPGRDMLLLNPDAELLGPLTLTLGAIRQPRVAAAAPMISEGNISEGVLPDTPPFFSDEQMPWDVAHHRVTLLNAICGMALPPQRLRGTWLSDRYRSRPTEVAGYLTGACLAIRRDAWDELGPFDEEFFLYGEEADWQNRATAEGWRLLLADEIEVIHAANGTVAGDSVASGRSDDLFRAGVALQLEYRHGRWAAECFLAIVSLIEFVKQRLRGRRGDGTQSDVVVTVDAPGDTTSATESITAAIELDRAGYAVTVVSLTRLGALPRDVPPSVRLIRRPWWWPSTAPDRTPSVLVEGTSPRERAFARLFRHRRNRVCVPPASALSSLGVMGVARTSTRNPSLKGN